MSDTDVASGGGMATLTGKISNRFCDIGCAGVVLHSGTLQVGDTIAVFKARSSRTGMGSQTTDDFQHTQVVDSIQVNNHRVSKVTVVEEDGGKKFLDVFFAGEDGPSRQSDRRCAIKVTRMPPNGAEVSLV